MPILNFRLFEKRLFDRFAIRRIYIMNTACFVARQIGMREKSRIEHGDSDAASRELWMRVDAQRKGQDPLFIE